MLGDFIVGLLLVPRASVCAPASRLNFYALTIGPIVRWNLCNEINMDVIRQEMEKSNPV